MLAVQSAHLSIRSCHPTCQGTVERQLRTTSAGIQLLARLPLSTVTLNEMLREQGTPLLHQRLKALGVNKMGHRISIANALREHVEGRTPLPKSLGANLKGMADQAPASPKLAPSGANSQPSSPYLQENVPDAAIVAAAVGSFSPTQNLIRTFCSLDSSSSPRSAPSPMPLANRTNMLNAPQASRERQKECRSRSKLNQVSSSLASDDSIVPDQAQLEDASPSDVSARLAQAPIKRSGTQSALASFLWPARLAWRLALDVCTLLPAVVIKPVRMLARMPYFVLALSIRIGATIAWRLISVWLSLARTVFDASASLMTRVAEMSPFRPVYAVGSNIVRLGLSHMRLWRGFD